VTSYRFRNSIIINLIASISASCASISTTVDEVSLNSPMPFSDCKTTEGGGDITIYNQGSLVFSSQYDWISKGSDSFQLELSDAMGRTQAGIDFVGDAGLAVTYGPSALADLEIGQSERGMIRFEKTETNIALPDLRCLLRGEVPARVFRTMNRIEPWFGSVYYSGNVDKGAVYLYPSPANSGGQCISYCWERRFVLFAVCADFCRATKANRKTKLSVGKYSADFTSED